ncbi:family 1 glycosylhydrolase [Gordonia otitidis]|uniref:family 1 glycosylhydrolase n=1 Tax=Gordonia otitidis TaxID=249058 RepID=UPI001D150F93|nr:family 1 glycosylhydrolase [Gordonia otitidis]UEA58611.1 family 1 glycosylhydrolase [Gordonia otitidis]
MSGDAYDAGSAPNPTPSRHQTRASTPVAAVVVAALVALAAAFVLPARADAAPSGHVSSRGLPPGFLWGVSSSGFQSEGMDPGGLHAGGRLPDSNWSRYVAAGKTDDAVGSSVDFRHRYRSDIALARSLGVRVYRVSVEWARIEPRPGVIDRRELAYYDDMIAAIVSAGMRPMITLDHWVYPGWIAARGGWAAASTPTAWLHNARFVVDRYARYDPLWITINEPEVYILNEVRMGGLPATASAAMRDRLVEVHTSIYRYIHQRQPGALVSTNIAYVPTVEPILDAAFVDLVRSSLDFIGLDYYYSASVTDLGAINAATGKPWKAPLSADGIYYSLRDLARRFPGTPLYVVETGMPTENGGPRRDGYRRGDHLRDLVYWVTRAYAEGYPVMGFNYWSLTDNYEWGSYTPRFGLYTVDVKTDPTLRRQPTDAVAAYREVTAHNGVGAAYRPTRPAQWCSLAAAPASCTQPVR